VTRGGAKRRLPSQQSAMGQEGEQRRVVIYYSGSRSSTGEQCCSEVCVSEIVMHVSKRRPQSFIMFSHALAEEVRMDAASEGPSIWQSQTLKLRQPKTGVARSDSPFRSGAHIDR
jgi:hypothetical protein